MVEIGKLILGTIEVGRFRLVSIVQCLGFDNLIYGTSH